MCVARLCTDVYALDTVQWRQPHNRDTDKELRTSKQTWDPTPVQQSSCHCRMTAVMRSHHTSATRQSVIDTLPMFTVRLEWKPGTCNLNPCRRFRHVCRESTTLQVQITVQGTKELWTLFSDTATCCTFINVFVTKSMIPWYAHPDSHSQ